MIENTARALLVLGDPTWARLATIAVQHEQLAPELASDEKTVVNALTSIAFDVAVVGGRIGKRGPAVLCDAVRARQNTVPVIVLIDEETETSQVEEHAARALPNVLYLDARGMSPTDRALGIRSAVMAVLAWTDDPSAAETVAQRVATDAAAPEPAVPESAAADADDAEIVLEADDTVVEALAVPEGVTEEDLLFAKRILRESRGVDFRSPVPPPTTTGPDAVAERLRARVRELERHLARLAHVHAFAVKQTDAALVQQKDAYEKKTAVDTELQRFREEVAAEREARRVRDAEVQAYVDAAGRDKASLEQRLAQAEQEVARTKDELGKREQGFAAMLKQAQDAFGALREQSAGAIAKLEAKLEEAEARAVTDKRRVADVEEQTRLKHELEEALTLAEQRKVEAEARAAALEHEKLAIEEQKQALVEEKQAVEQALAEQRANDATSAARLTKIKESILALRSALEERTRDLEARADALKSREQELAAARAEAAALRESMSRLPDGSSSEDVRQGLQALHQDSQRLHDDLRAALETLHADKEDLRAKVEAAEHSILAAIPDEPSPSLDLSPDLERVSTQLADLREILSETANQTQAQAGRLEGVHSEVARLAEHRAQRDELDRQKARDSVLEARLVAIEETVRSGISKLATTAKTAAAPPPPTTWVDYLKNAPAPILVAAGGITLLLVLLAVLPWLLAPEETVAPAVVAQAPAAPTSVPIPAPDAVAEAKQPEAAPAAAPEPVAEAPAQAQAPAAEPPPAAGPPVDRKALRKEMFDAFKAKKYDKAADAGLRLKAAFELDWEAELKLGDALYKANRHDEAVRIYQGFVERYPTNAHADAALFKIGSMLAKTDKAAAIKALEKVAQDPKSKYQGEARQALAQLGQ